MTDVGMNPRRARAGAVAPACADAAERGGDARCGTTHPPAPPKVLWRRQAGPGGGLLPREPGSRPSDMSRGIWTRS
jgi:hypothetical protein